MANPLLTILVDIALVGTVIFVAASMLREHFAGRRAAVGRRPRSATPATLRWRRPRPESALKRTA